MKKIKFSFAIIICLCSFVAMATTVYFTKALVDFDAFEKLTAEVKNHRKDRLINVDEFIKMSKEKGTIILDTRSDAMYKGKHVKGAIHLDFTDFTAANLSQLIPNNTTRILIYCNNNFDDKPLFARQTDYFVTKAARPTVKFKNQQLTALTAKSRLTLALNIPTYINLYGYGYKNVYELNELVSTAFDKRIEFEGTAVVKP
ncbi:MAG: rhodanese-like domain-containing protein [Chitinophagaceae bacterium]|nr:rhodanese-like domain-containing protein [Chitinophagaceae bacterium]